MCEMDGQAVTGQGITQYSRVSQHRPSTRAMREASNNNNTVCHQNNWD